MSKHIDNNSINRYIQELEAERDRELVQRDDERTKNKEIELEDNKNVVRQSVDEALLAGGAVMVPMGDSGEKRLSITATQHLAAIAEEGSLEERYVRRYLDRWSFERHRKVNTYTRFTGITLDQLQERLRKDGFTYHGYRDNLGDTPSFRHPISNTGFEVEVSYHDVKFRHTPETEKNGPFVDVQIIKPGYESSKTDSNDQNRVKTDVAIEAAFYRVTEQLKDLGGKQQVQ